MSSVASSNKTPRGVKPAFVPSGTDAQSTPIRNKQPSVERVTDRLETPSLDDRSYRVIRLSNQLEVLLVHDAETDKASAALDVNVGSFSDEADMPGMAHAVEHLLFAGSKKYPIENAYNQYISAQSGYSDSYTGGTSTNYFFEPGAKSTDDNELNEDSSSLYGAPDRFSQFSIESLFLSSSLDRELKAVTSENKKNLQRNKWQPNHCLTNDEIFKTFPGSQKTQSQEHDYGDIEMARVTQRKHRRGRGARKNNAYWKEINSEVNTNPFDGRELLFEDGYGSLRASRMANLDTQLKISKHKGDDLVMSSHCAKELGLLGRISSDFEDPCLRSISGHSTAVKGILTNVQFRLKGGSVTFRRDFWVSDSINDIVDVMIGANFIKDHFKLLFERVKEYVSTFATWFSKKRETPEQKAEREERERQQQIQILENETKRLRVESEMYKKSGRANDGSQQGGSQRAPLAGRS